MLSCNWEALVNSNFIIRGQGGLEAYDEVKGGEGVLKRLRTSTLEFGSNIVILPY